MQKDRSQKNEHKVSLLVSILSLIVSGFSAFFVYWQASTTVDTESRQLRAYVSVIGKEVRNYDTPNEIKTVVSIKNFGLTPAYHVQVICNYSSVFSMPMDVGYKYPPCEYDPKNSTIVVHPQEKLNTDPHPLGTLKTDLMSDITDGEKAKIGTYGTIWYTDAFGKVHHTNYCHLWDGNNIRTGHPTPCNQHNDAD